MNARRGWIGASSPTRRTGRLTARAQWLRKSGSALLAGGLILLGFTLLAQLWL